MNKFPPKHVEIVDGILTISHSEDKTDVEATGADIRVYERLDRAIGTPAPYCININGVELLTTLDSSVEAHPIRLGKDEIVVDIKGIICRSLTFDQEVVEPENPKPNGLNRNPHVKGEYLP